MRLGAKGGSSIRIAAYHWADVMTCRNVILKKAAAAVKTMQSGISLAALPPRSSLLVLVLGQVMKQASHKPSRDCLFGLISQSFYRGVNILR